MHAAQQRSDSVLKNVCSEMVLRMPNRVTAGLKAVTEQQTWKEFLHDNGLADVTDLIGVHDAGGVTDPDVINGLIGVTDGKEAQLEGILQDSPMGDSVAQSRSSFVIARIHTSALRKELDVVRKSISRRDKERAAEITRQLATLGHARGVRDLHFTPSAQRVQKR